MSLRTSLIVCAAVVLTLAWAAPARAAIINGIDWREVDASNSTVASGSIETDGFGTGDQTDNNWDYSTPYGVIGPGDSDERDATGNGTGMYMSNASETVGKLTVTIPGVLNPSTTYTVFVVFRDNFDLDYGVLVSLDDSNWQWHTSEGADTNLDGTIDTTGATYLGQDTDLGKYGDYYYVDAGVGTVTGETDLVLYFKDADELVTSGAYGSVGWSIIDAVGFVPEPATLALVGLGGLGLVLGRKRR